jgi:hypothetical protein
VSHWWRVTAEHEGRTVGAFVMGESIADALNTVERWTLSDWQCNADGTLSGLPRVLTVGLWEES